MIDLEKQAQLQGMLADPGPHFTGRFEVERKFWVPDLEVVRKRLEELDAIPFTLGNTETDIFFDCVDAKLKANNQSLSLRRMQPSGRGLMISKGPAKDQCVAMDLFNFDQTVLMLNSLGYKETNRITKQRDILFVDIFHVTLDEIAGLGTFVELAIMTDNEELLPELAAQVQQAAQRLGLLQYKEEMRSYKEMLMG